jgi:5-methylcytosine-specific restriction endonuclease McrA
MLAASPLCATGCGRLATIDDHVENLAEGGDLDDPENRQGLCQTCSNEKTFEESRRGKARER